MNLAIARGRAGLTQAELAKRADVPQSVVSDLENGKTIYPRLDTAMALAKVLGCTIDELFAAKAASER